MIIPEYLPTISEERKLVLFSLLPIVQIHYLFSVPILLMSLLTPAYSSSYYLRYLAILVPLLLPLQWKEGE